MYFSNTVAFRKNYSCIELSCLSCSLICKLELKYGVFFEKQSSSWASCILAVCRGDEILPEIFHFDSCQTWQLSNWKISCFFFCMKLARSIWSSAGTLFSIKNTAYLRLFSESYKSYQNDRNPLHSFFKSETLLFWVLMKICVKHQDQRVDFLWTLINAE